MGRREIEEAPLEKGEEVGGGEIGENRSVYFDSEQGTELDSNAAGFEVRKVNLLTAKNKLGHGKAEFSNHEGVTAEEENQDCKNVGLLIANTNGENGKVELHNDRRILVEEETQDLKCVRVENESNLHHHSIKNYVNEIARSENEIEEHHQDKQTKFGKLVVAEIDVERVLEEQETHDLFCPNCNSCITKRVILRKRKRTVRESHYDAPPEKLRQLQHDQEANSASESAELGHQNEPDIFFFQEAEPEEAEPDIFRCLSCFSFFIPRDAGFNIFQICGKREEIKNLQSSQQVPERSMNWFSSFFKPKISKRKTEAGVLSPVESHVISGGDVIVEENQSSSALTVLDATKMRENQTTTGNKDAGSLPEQPYTNVGVGDEAQKDTQNYPAKNLSEGMNLGGSQTTFGRSDAGENIKKPSSQDKPTFPKGTSESDLDINGSTPPDVIALTLGDSFVKPADMAEPSLLIGNTQSNQNIQCSLPPTAVVLPQGETHISVGGPSAAEAGRDNDWDVLKSIVYGGLIESTTSLGVVSSAAGADTSTLNIFALGLANLVGGLFVIAHDLSELRSTQDHEATDQRDEPVGRYRELLGRRANFRLHATVAILSYIIFGLLPPIVYGFSFQKSDNKEYKLIAVAAASLMCIALLAIGKAHVRPQKAYIKSLSYYLGLGVTASGFSYVAGMMIDRLLLELGLFNSSEAAPSIEFSLGSAIPAWASR